MFRSKSILKTWYISYALILLVMILTNIYIMNNTSSKMRAEIEMSNKYFMRNLTVSVDNMFSEADRLKNEVQKTQELKSFASNDRVDETIRLEAASITRSLEKIVMKYNALDCICYYPKSDIVITPYSFSESEIYYSLSTENNEGYEEWKKELFGDKKRYSLYKMKNKQGDMEEVIGITTPVLGENKEINYVIRVYIDKKEMFQMIGKDEVAAILDSRGNLLISSDGNTYDFTNIWLKNDDIYKTKSMNINGKKVYVCYAQSKRYLNNYVCISPKNDYLNKNLQLIFICLLGNILCVAIVIFIMYATSKWNYKNIRSIIGNTDADMFKEKNEYEIIKNKIDVFMKNNNELQEKLDSQMNVVKDNFLANFLEGYVDYESINGYMELYDNISKDECFFVVSLFIKNYGILSKDSRKSVVFAINNILNDVFWEDKYLYTEINKIPVYIINCRDTDNETKEKIIALFKEVKALTYEILKAEFTVGISRTEKGFENVPKLYKESVIAMECAKFYNLSEFMRIENIETVNDEKDIINYDSEAKLKNKLMLAIKNKNIVETRKVTDEIFCVSHYMTDARGYYLRILYNIMNEVIAYAKQDSDDVYKKVLYHIKNIEDGTTIDDMKKIMYLSAKILCENNMEENKDISQENDICAITEKYVKEHFNDVDLNISSIGEYLGMNAFYISKIFKECKGVKLTTYINDLRIECAGKILLEEPGKKVDDIAREVGYDNTRTFLSQFKNKMGVTPTQYRNLNKKSD